MAFEDISGIKLEYQIGNGATSVVYKGTIKSGGEFSSLSAKSVAVKILRSMPVDKDLRRFMNEVTIGRSISCVNLVKYFTNGIYKGEFGDLPFIISEYIEGLGLKQYVARILAENKVDQDKAIVSLIKGILTGLEQLNANQIIHRDIQPNNIIVREGVPVIIDYGVSKFFNNKEYTSVWEEIGTRRYWAPELTDPTEERWATSSDVFSVASVMIHMITGNFVFSECTNYPTYFLKLNNYFDKSSLEIPEMRLIPEHLENTKELLSFMLINRPDSRPNATDILKLINDAPDGDIKAVNIVARKLLQRDRLTKADLRKVIKSSKTSEKLAELPRDNRFPLSEFIFQFRNTNELKLLDCIADAADEDRMISTGELLSLFESKYSGWYHEKQFVEAMHLYGGWGLIKQLNPNDEFFRQEPDELVVFESCVFQPMAVAVAIRDKMKNEISILSTSCEIFWETF